MSERFRVIWQCAAILAICAVMALLATRREKDLPSAGGALSGEEGKSSEVSAEAPAKKSPVTSPATTADKSAVPQAALGHAVVTA